MDKLTLRLPGELRSQLEAEATERGVPVSEHIREIVEVHCRGQRRLDRPAIEVQYTHSVSGAGGQTETSVDQQSQPSTEELGSFRYGSRSVLP